TAKFYISISYQKDLLSIDTRIFTPSVGGSTSRLTMAHTTVHPRAQFALGVDCDFFQPSIISAA
ncbi:hypothetical protein, partial [Anaerotruncus colihominis]